MAPEEVRRIAEAMAPGQVVHARVLGKDNREHPVFGTLQVTDADVGVTQADRSTVWLGSCTLMSGVLSMIPHKGRERFGVMPFNEAALAASLNAQTAATEAQGAAQVALGTAQQSGQVAEEAHGAAQHALTTAQRVGSQTEQLAQTAHLAGTTAEQATSTAHMAATMAQQNAAQLEAVAQQAMAAQKAVEEAALQYKEQLATIAKQASDAQKAAEEATRAGQKADDATTETQRQLAQVLSTLASMSSVQQEEARQREQTARDVRTLRQTAALGAGGAPAALMDDVLLDAATAEDVWQWPELAVAHTMVGMRAQLERSFAVVLGERAHAQAKEEAERLLRQLLRAFEHVKCCEREGVPRMCVEYALREAEVAVKRLKALRFGQERRHLRGATEAWEAAATTTAKPEWDRSVEQMALQQLQRKSPEREKARYRTAYGRQDRTTTARSSGGTYGGGTGTHSGGDGGGRGRDTSPPSKGPHKSGFRPHAKGSRGS